ncbi:hypothetical protein NMY22_g4134 [Coprinellus aureogranulatus]|nr:hypothetical protein NMY22_g4134 [Coprinellus aureogranulatus]
MEDDSPTSLPDSRLIAADMLETRARMEDTESGPSSPLPGSTAPLDFQPEGINPVVEDSDEPLSTSAAFMQLPPSESNSADLDALPIWPEPCDDYDASASDASQSVEEEEDYSLRSFSAAERPEGLVRRRQAQAEACRDLAVAQRLPGRLVRPEYREVYIFETSHETQFLSTDPRFWIRTTSRRASAALR